MALGKLVDRHGSPVGIPARAPKGGTLLVRCGLLYRRGQGEADRLCIPAGGGLRMMHFFADKNSLFAHSRFSTVFFPRKMAESKEIVRVSCIIDFDDIQV